ncbi:MAG TPA: hypothetical protein VFB38_02055 [Chthonomonadaceae bacterium]|nr:hypothetical protein [Chthonomonadaceae bacterium]
MKVRLHFRQDKIHIDEEFAGKSADEVVGAMKARVMKELPFAMRLVVGTMSNLGFAQEVVRRYNESQKKSLPVPESCAEFLTLAQGEGLATIEEA